METKSWKLLIVSTGYDLADIRDIVFEDIQKLGFKVLAYEKAGYPVEPFAHSHDACIIAIQQADIIVLIVDKSYGGFYIGSTGISITHEEYSKAIHENKVIIPCIRKKAWEERHSYFKNAGKNRAKKDYKVAYVESERVLNFIEEIRKADKDNFVITFDNPSELLEYLIGRLKGLSRYVFELLIKEQMKVVRAAKTSTGMNLSLGDVLDKGYFIEPPYVINSGDRYDGVSILDYIDKIQEDQYGIAVYGGPGSGKSTIIASAFLKQAKKFLEAKSYHIPFFLSLRGKGVDYSFSFPKYLETSFQIFLKKDLFPGLDIKVVSPFFYIDGFDELTEETQKINLQLISNSDIFNYAFVLTCRTRFAKDYLNEITFGSKLNSILELTNWGPEIAESYISLFFEIHNKPELSHILNQYFQDNIDLKEITSNPLLLTLFLWVVEECQMALPLNIKNTINLFDKCIELWIKRDLSRFNLDGSPEGRKIAKDIRIAWQYTAWEIYKSRFGSENPLTMKELKDKIAVISEDLISVIDNKVFQALLTTNEFNEELNGMMHEQFLEHFTAYALTDGMKLNRKPFPDSLKIIVRPEINRKIRAIWSMRGTRCKEKTLENLKSEYYRNIEHIDQKSIFARNQAMYYVGRLDIPASENLLKNVNTIEKDNSVKISISFGLIKKGDLNEEAEFFMKLNNIIDWDRANRGYHLAYYRDSKESDPPYFDDEKCSWQKTMNALLLHFESNEKRHIYIRRIELFTIRRLIETRSKVFPLDESTLKNMENKIINSTEQYNDFTSEFFMQIQREFQLLFKSWQSNI